MFERFTERARQSIVFAQEEARSFRHNFIGTEHLLLGLIREEDGLAAQVFLSAGVELDSARELVENLHEPDAKSLRSTPPFTPRAKASLEKALRSALELSHHYISTEHLLLGILHESGGGADELLGAWGLDKEVLEEELLLLIQGREEEPPEELAASGPSGRRRSSGKAVDNYGRNLTEIARKGKLDPVIGREMEIERLVQILSRRTKNNPVLVGEPGVGKTAIVEGLAQRIAKGEVPPTIENYQLYTLDLAALVAGSRYRGEFEERLKKLLKEVQKSDDVLLFIDEIHTLVGAGAAEGSLDAASILKPMLSRGELRVIGATTNDEFRKYLEKDSALERRFQKITVDAPTIEETGFILRGLADKYADHHEIEILDEALLAAAELSDRFIPDRQLPDKAIDLIDEAASRKRIKAMQNIPDKEEWLLEIERIREEKAEAIEDEDYELAASLREKEKELRSEKKETRVKPEPLNAQDIAEIVSMWTGVPAKQLTSEEKARLVEMEKELHLRVIGQKEAVASVSKAIRRSRAGIRDPKRPTGSFLFLGPTGVGKTELAKTLSQFMFGDDEALLRIDMSEYMEKHSVSRLIGSPPGYVGHEEGGQLTEMVRRKPYSVVLLDEIEKAHPEVYNILLQILEDGALTDSQGRKVDFKNTVIIMTSNLGAAEISKKNAIGFADRNSEGLSSSDIKGKVKGELKQAFRPELINRIDEIVVFDQLKKEEVREIVDLMISRVEKQAAEHSLDLRLSSGAKDLLVERGWDPSLGARPLRRAIQVLVEDPLADEVLRAGEIAPGTKVKIDLARGKNTEEHPLRLRLEGPRKKALSKKGANATS